MSATPCRFAPLFLASALAACATSAPREAEVAPQLPVDAVVERLSGRLVAAAELRTDLNAMRLAVWPVEDALSEGRSARASLEEGAVSLGDELRDQFQVALSEHLHVFDAELAGASEESWRHSNPSRLASELGATHVLLGEVGRRGEDILLAIRLVDARTNLIVAAEREHLSAGSLGTWGAAFLSAPQPEVRQAVRALPPAGAAPTADTDVLGIRRSGEPGYLRTPSGLRSTPSTSTSAPVAQAVEQPIVTIPPAPSRHLEPPSSREPGPPPAREAEPPPAAQPPPPGPVASEVSLPELDPVDGPAARRLRAKRAATEPETKEKDEHGPD